MSEHHQYQHVAMAVRSGETIEQAIFNAVAGLTDPQGYHGHMTFDAFEVLDVKGAIAHKPGDHGTPARVQVTIQAIGTHEK
jgi:flavin-binding protein dodecin